MISGKQKIKKDDWKTPDWLFKKLNNRFVFTVDAASTEENKKTYTRMLDGLVCSWRDQRVFCNPPFSTKSQWMKKAHDEVLNGGCHLCVMLLPNCIDTIAFNEYVHGKFYWEHLPHRVSFLDDNGTPIKGNPSGTIIVYFWKKICKE